MLSRYPIEIIHITNTRGKARFARLPLDPFLWKTNQFISIVPYTRPNGTEQISIQHFFIVRVSKRPSGAKLYSKILFLRSAGALRARSACEQTYISSKSFFRLTLQLFLTVQVSKQPLGANLCSKKHIFAHCGRARTKNGSYPDRFWAKTVPTSYRTPALVHPVPITPAQNIYYYIDVFNSAFTVYFKLIIAHQTFKVSALNSI